MTGAVQVKHGGVSYQLRLTMRGIAELQAEFGRDIAGLLSGRDGDIPDFNAVLRLIEVALLKGTPSIDATTTSIVAEDIATIELVGKVVQAAFPEAGSAEGNVRRAGSPKAA